MEVSRHIRKYPEINLPGVSSNIRTKHANIYFRYDCMAQTGDVKLTFEELTVVSFA